jgi:Domain of unknown function (DUF397)
MTRDVKWIKSSLSGGGNENCVELAPGRVRDSKNPDGPTLTVDLPRLLDAVRTGRFDLS